MAVKPERGVLFLCVANSARSQIAEGLARSMAPKDLRIHSAGSHPYRVHPYAIEVLREQGIDPSGQFSKAIQEVPLEEVDLVVTLCAQEVCPALPAGVRHLHWPFEDPGGAAGSEPELLQSFRRIRDGIRERLESLF